MSTQAGQIDGPDGAPVLVLLSSIGATSEMWAPVLAPLTEQFRVVRIDTRGHGASPPAVAGGSTTIEDLGRDVLAVLDELSTDRVHLAGLSLGGMTAIWIAIHHPERIARLALLCTSSHVPPARSWLDRAATVRRDGMAAIAEERVRLWVTPAFAAANPDVVARFRAMIVAVDAESYAQCCEAIAAMDQRADLARIAAPTLVIAGRQDEAMPRPHAQLIVDSIAGAQLEVVDPAAHIPTAEQPGAIAELLLRHFQGGATLAAGYATRRAVLGDAHVERSIEATTEFTAPFQEFLTRYAWGDVWSRPQLSRRDRSIATLAALVAIGAEHELGMHVRAARRNGLTPEEITEVLLHTALYAGLPRANRAFAIASEALAAEETPTD
jgi:3-oxoadipate enol-lactonase / 4-carboxymuconolactone decarboxylase